MSHKYPCVYYDNGKCQKFSDEKYNSWCDFDSCESRTPSNGDIIRAMSDEDLSEFLYAVDIREGATDTGGWLDFIKQTYGGSDVLE
jgi:hypothetical protein